VRNNVGNTHERGELIFQLIYCVFLNL